MRISDWSSDVCSSDLAILPAMTISPIALDSLDAAVDLLLTRCGNSLRMAAPLGLGKPHRLLNAITRRVTAQPDVRLKLYTALSLTPPTPRTDTEKRFRGPFRSEERGVGEECVSPFILRGLPST